MRNATSLPLYLSTFFLILLFSFTISAQEYNDVWLRDWVNNQGISNTLAGRNLSITAGDHVYEAVHQLNDNGQHDLVLTKSTLKGVQVWIDTFNLTATTANILLGDMVLDGNDDILITGAVYNGSNNYDALTLKYTSAGSLSWYELYDGTASFYDGGLRIAVDVNDDVFVTGGTSSSTSNMDLLVLAYESDGTPSWSATYDGFSAFDAGSYVDAGGVGSLHIVAISESSTSTGSKWQVADRKYNPANGNLILSEISGEISLSEVRDVSLDANDNIYLTGWKPTTNQGRNIVVVKLDDGATIQWERTFNGTTNADDQSNAIAVASNGDVIVGGFTTTSSGDRDGLLLKYNSSGTLQWQQTISGAANGEDEITDILLATGSNEIYLCGQIHEGADEDYLFQRRSSGTGSLLHELTFAGWVGGTDRAEVLLEDEEGGIIMSGKTAAGANGQFPTAVRFAKKDYFLPPNSETPNAALPYIHQYDQLTKTNGTVAEDIKYYAGNHFLENAQLSIVQARIDTVPTTPDTLCRVDVTFSDDKSQRVFALDKRSSYHNYYLGHINEGRTKVPLTDQVLHTDAWTGIDLLHGSNGAGHTYDIIIEPGVDPDDIVFTFTGHTSLAVNGSGELEITTALGTIVWPEPTLSSYDAAGTSYSNTDTPAYSVVSSNKVEITGVNSVSNRYLVIGVRGGVMASPTGGLGNLEWCTFFGGNRDDFTQDLDAFSNIEGDDFFVTGYTLSSSFPTNSGFQQILASQAKDAFLTYFNEDVNLIWSTYLGGEGNDEGFTVLAESDKIIIGGLASGYGTENNANNFPLIDNGSNLFDNENRSATSLTTCSDGFLARFDYDGVPDFITFFGEDGASNQDKVLDITKNTEGQYIIVGQVGSTAVLELNDASFYRTSGRSFIAKIDSDFSDVLWGTHFPAGQTWEVEVDADDNIFIAGVSQNTDNTDLVQQTQDSYIGSLPTTDNPQAFIAKFSPAPHTLLWSTYFGGDGVEQLYDLKLSIAGEPIIVGYSSSLNFPLTSNITSPFNGNNTTSTSGFFSNFSNTGELVFSGLLGSYIWDLDTDDEGRIHLGAFPSPGLPVTGPSGAYQVSTFSAAYFLSMDQNRNILWSTYLGGTGDLLTEIKVTQNNRLFFGGTVQSAASNTFLGDFPTVMYNHPQSFFSNRILTDNSAIFSVFLGRFDLNLISSVDNYNKEELDVVVFPNPTSNMIHIVSTKLLNEDIFLYNVEGRLIKQEYLKNKSSYTCDLDVSNLPAGIYFLSSLNWEGAKKIIISQ